MTGQAKKSVPFLAGSGKISDRSEPERESSSETDADREGRTGQFRKSGFI